MRLDANQLLKTRACADNSPDEAHAKKKEKTMSSGINWRYRISNRNPEEPPISYSIGVAWVSGGQSPDHEGLTVGFVYGLDAVRTAYAQLPGLGNHRELWLKARISGPEEIADTAAKLQLARFAQQSGKRTPLGYGGDPSETLGEYISGSAFVCGREIAEHAGLALEDKFLDVWHRFAIAAEEYPRDRWGICPKVTALKVETWGVPADGGGKELDRENATRVLKSAPMDLLF